jgi:hypothetical protein
MNLEMTQTPALRPRPALPAVEMRPPALKIRLARVILDLAECAEIDVANSIFLTGAISNERLAVLAGAKADAVARLTAQFVSLGLVEKRRQRFIIRQPERLRAMIAELG